VLLLAAIAVVGCDEKQGEGDTPDVMPTLLVSPANISAPAAGDAYAFSLACNTVWTAAVSSGATWCTVQPAAGNGDATGTITIAKNTAPESRTATVTFTAGTLTRAVAMTQAALTVITPPNAASTQTWVFGDQTWSDAIHIPNCNKSSFVDSYTDPQCRSYTENSTTWYYYNWPYVNVNAVALCPSPWRVPLQSDFGTLVSTLGGNTQSARDALIAAWGFTGYALGNSVYKESDGTTYWSATGYDGDEAYTLSYVGYYAYGLYINPQSIDLMYYGFPVRCVKDN
jgi:uncharacterized protein (TIGR02145 family)